MRRRTIPIWAILAVTVLAAPARAAVFTVNDTSDAVDASPGDGVCDIGGGLCTLRAAVQEANALAGPDTIELGAQTYVLTLAGAGEDLAATGDLDVRETLTVEGAGAAATVIDAGGLDRVFEVHDLFGVSPDFTLRNATVTGGQVTDVGGAGIRVLSAGTVLLEDVAIVDNHELGSASEAVGGGVCAQGGGTLTILRSRLAGGLADRGGALFNNGTATVEDSTLEGNTAGAGSAIEGYGAVILRRTTISGNTTTVNGTIRSPGGSLTMENCTVSGNTDPAAVISVFDSSAAVHSSTIVDNDASYGLFASTNGLIKLGNSIVSNPLASDDCATAGGGVLADDGYNLDGDGTCATGSTGDLPATDPMLGPLADNGGPTRTHLPLAGSPAIDAGSSIDCPAVDQRGAARPFDGDGNGSALCDIGAVEVPEPGAGALGLAAAAALAAWAHRKR